MIREDFLQQNSFADVDAYSAYDRQGRMMGIIKFYDEHCRSAAARGGSLSELFAIPAREKIGRMKSVAEEQYKDAYANLLVEMEEQIGAIAVFVMCTQLPDGSLPSSAWTTAARRIIARILKTPVAGWICPFGIR